MDKAQQLFAQGFALQQKGQAEEAAALYERVLAQSPAHFDALHLLGVIRFQSGQLERALELLDRAIALNPGVAAAHTNRGALLHELGRFDEAVASHDKAIACKPDYATAWYNRGNTLFELERFEEAAASYDRAIAFQPGYAGAFYNRGNALEKLGRLDQALASHDRAIALRPIYPEAYLNRGNVLKGLKRLPEALASHEKAIALRSDYIEAQVNRGTVLQELKRFSEALASHDAAISLRPGYADAHLNRGVVLQELRRFDDAIASYDRAIEIKPRSAEAWFSRASALVGRKAHAEAVLSYERAREIDPDYDFVDGHLLHQKMLCCDWSDLDRQVEKARHDIDAGKLSAEPFGWQGLADSDASLQKCARIWNAAKYPRVEDGRTGAIRGAPRDPDGRIRIGYLSGEFREQATSHLIAGMLEQHDKSRFEVFGFDSGMDDGSSMRRRIDHALDEVIGIRNLDDASAALRIRDAGVDILVNLYGYFGDQRTGVFARKPAPLQVNYLGFPGTMGADYIDYIVADRTVIPLERQSCFDEKVVYLPDSYQVNDRERRISARVCTREECGLPQKGFVFCCFNNNYKIVPATFDGWMRLLRSVDGSVLWLIESNPAAPDNLRREAQKRGVDGDRLVFARRLPLDEHLARHRLADLFVDTLPYNAHTTASDALWAGLPMLTCLGNSFAGRVGASLMGAIGLPELITATQAEYEALAIALAREPERLAGLRQKLDRNRLSTPLFDTRLFTRHIEQAYVAMIERHRLGLAPASIEVTPC